MHCCSSDSIQVSETKQQQQQQQQQQPKNMAPSEFALAPHASIPKAEGPVLVVILDGFGENEFKGER